MLLLCMRDTSVLRSRYQACTQCAQKGRQPKGLDPRLRHRASSPLMGHTQQEEETAGPAVMVFAPPCLAQSRACSTSAPPFSPGPPVLAWARARKEMFLAVKHVEQGVQACGDIPAALEQLGVKCAIDGRGRRGLPCVCGGQVKALWLDGPREWYSLR